VDRRHCCYTTLADIADSDLLPTPGRRGDPTMIQNDQELKVARERITYLLDLLARLRVSSRPEELALVSGGYRAEVECMQRDVIDYLMQPAIKPTAKAG
jgi:hypothetical protein